MDRRPKGYIPYPPPGDLWVKTVISRELAVVLFDRGLLWAEGDVHRRHRKALAPAFGLSESKALMPRFLSVANNVREDHWRPPTLPLSIVDY